MADRALGYHWCAPVVSLCSLVVGVGSAVHTWFYVPMESSLQSAREIHLAFCRIFDNLRVHCVYVTVKQRSQFTDGWTDEPKTW